MGTGFTLSKQKAESVVEKQGMLVSVHLTLDARSVIHTLNTDLVVIPGWMNS
jgi:hypothetical protein